MGCVGSPNYISLSPYKISFSAQKIPKSFTSHWFLIQVISSIIDIYTFGNSKEIYFTSKNMVANGWFKMHLNQDQFNFLKDSTYFNLYPVENKYQINSARSIENNGFYVHASKDWTPPADSRIVSRISDTIFYVDNIILDEQIQKDPRVLKITPASKKQSFNRYISGFLQNGHQKSYYSHNIFAPIRTLHQIGLNGSGQIVNVVDSGVDVNNAFFYDPNPENDLLSITGKTNVNHRKVVRIEPIADNTDAWRGHGTHVAGTACGSSYCSNCGISQYNGISPESKLYFSDIGNTTTGELSGTVDLYEQYEIFEQLDIHVSSNSWGYPKNNPEVQFNYNKAAYDHPYVLYLFAAGNSQSYNTINCPGDSKNVLTVSASDFVSSSYLEFFQSSISIQNESHSIEAEETMNTLVFKKSIGEPLKFFVNLSVKSYVEDSNVFYNDSLVVLNTQSGLDDKICSMAQKVENYGAEAAVYLTDDPEQRCDEPLPKIPLIKLTNKSDISILLDMKNCSLINFQGEERKIPACNFLSSKGPADSALKKPDIIIPGTNIYSASALGPDLDGIEITSDFDENVVSKSGTSMATPAASGLSLIILQYLREGFYPGLKKGSGSSLTPSSCLLRGLLVNTAIKPDMEENESKMSPRNDVGFGTPFLENVLGFNDTGLRFVDNETIESNSHRVYRIILDSNKADLSITLVYLDPPLNVDNDAILFADLDLYVKSPQGQIYFGNNVPDGDVLGLIERVVFEKDEIPENGGEFEIHVVSSNYPIEHQKVMYSIVVNGPFDMKNIDSNPLFLTAKEAAENDCPNDCSGNGKCQRGKCVCFESFVGASCATKEKVLEEGTSLNETFKYRDIKYYQMSLKESSSSEKVEKISFDIEKSFNFAQVYFCTSFDEYPGKLTDSGWECHLACPPNDEDESPFFANYSLQVPLEKDPKFFHMAVYTGYYDVLFIGINNIRLSKYVPVSSKSEIPPAYEEVINKIPPLTIPIIILVLSLVVIAAVILVLIIIIIRKKKKLTDEKSSLNVKLVSQDNSTF